MLDSAKAYEPRRGTCAKSESNASPPRNLQLIVEGPHHMPFSRLHAAICGDTSKKHTVEFRRAVSSGFHWRSRNQAYVFRRDKCVRRCAAGSAHASATEIGRASCRERV